MRTIKFRGMDPKAEKWVYGFYIHYEDFFRKRESHRIKSGAADSMPEEGGYDFCSGETEVLEETIGEYTGLTDALDKEIYEGDLVMLEGNPKDYRIVVFYEQAFCLATPKEYQSLENGAHPYLNDYAHMPCLNEWMLQPVYVVGNIHEGPDESFKKYF